MSGSEALLLQSRIVTRRLSLFHDPSKNSPKSTTNISLLARLNSCEHDSNTCRESYLLPPLVLLVIDLWKQCGESPGCHKEGDLLSPAWFLQESGPPTRQAPS